MKDTEQLKKIATYTIRLIASLINGKKPPEKSEDISWEEVKEFSEKHSVLGLVSYACEMLENPPSAEMTAFLREYRKEKMVIEAQQQIVTEDAMDIFEENGIPHMALKGFIIKNMYPSPDMRQMSDIDFLIAGDKLDKAAGLLIDEGFSQIGEGEIHKNLKRGNVHFELHDTLVNACYTKMYAYFKDGFARAELQDGCGFRYVLSDEDMYVFILAHLAKHYIYEGTGIRSVLDIYIYRRFCSNMDSEYVRAETEKLGIAAFSEKIEQIASDWFGGDFSGDFDSISSYIVTSGTYGKGNDVLINEIVSRGSGDIEKAKSSNVREILFPSYDMMSIRYPVLKKLPFLLPLFYLVRVVETLLFDSKRISLKIKETNEILNIDDELVAAFRDSGLDVF